MTMKKNVHLGSSFDSFLEEEGILAEVEAAATKRVIAFEMRQSIEGAGMSKVDFAGAMSTSRAAVDRLLDTDNTSVTLSTLVKAAIALGKQLSVRLVDRVSVRHATLVAFETKPARDWPQTLEPAEVDLFGSGQFVRTRGENSKGLPVAA
jgi:antitoxin HicB